MVNDFRVEFTTVKDGESKSLGVVEMLRIPEKGELVALPLPGGGRALYRVAEIVTEIKSASVQEYRRFVTFHEVRLNPYVA